MRPQKKSYRQHGDQDGRRPGLHGGHIFLVVMHPVHIVLCVLFHCSGIFFIRSGGLAESLYYLDPAYILDDGICHTFSYCNCAFPADCIGFSALAHDGHTDHSCDKGSKSHSPVQCKNIYCNGNRYQKVGCHLRDQMGQRGLHPFHTVYDGCFILSGWSIQNGSHWHSGKLGQHFFTDIPQSIVGCCMGHGRGPCRTHRLYQITDQKKTAPWQALAEISIFQKNAYHRRNTEIRSHGSCHTKYSQNY